jgi:hypothetical protein
MEFGRYARAERGHLNATSLATSDLQHFGADRDIAEAEPNRARSSYPRRFSLQDAFAARHLELTQRPPGDRRRCAGPPYKRQFRFGEGKMDPVNRVLPGVLGIEVDPLR